MRKFNLSVFVYMAILFFVMGNTEIKAQGNSQNMAEEIIFGTNSDYSNIFNADVSISDAEEHWWKFEGKEWQSVQFMAKSDATNENGFLLMAIKVEGGDNISSQFYYRYDNSFNSLEYNAMCKVALLPENDTYYVKVLSVGYSGNYDFIGANPALKLPFLEEVEENWICTQGNNGAFSHYINALGRDYRYAWDFYRADKKEYIIAPSSGIVSYLDQGFNHRQENGNIYMINNDFIEPDYDVIQSGNINHGVGNVVVINHLDDKFSVFPHIKFGESYVENGDYVFQGQIIGVMWRTGFSTDNHIHYHLSDGTGNNASIPYPYYPESITSAFIDYNSGQSIPIAGVSYSSQNPGAPLHLNNFTISGSTNPQFSDHFYKDDRIIVNLGIKSEFEKSITMDDVVVSLYQDGVHKVDLSKVVEGSYTVCAGGAENFIFGIQLPIANVDTGKCNIVAKVQVDGKWLILGASHDAVYRNRKSIYIEAIPHTMHMESTVLNSTVFEIGDNIEFDISLKNEGETSEHINVLSVNFTDDPIIDLNSAVNNIDVNPNQVTSVYSFNRTIEEADVGTHLLTAKVEMAGNWFFVRHSMGGIVTSKVPIYIKELYLSQMDMFIDGSPWTGGDVLGGQGFSINLSIHNFASYNIHIEQLEVVLRDNQNNEVIFLNVDGAVDFDVLSGTTSDEYSYLLSVTDDYIGDHTIIVKVLVNGSWIGIGSYNGNNNYIPITIGAEPVVPPSDLNTEVVTPTQIDLSWVDNSINESGFSIWRMILGSKNMEMIGTVGVDEVEYSDMTVVPYTVYEYMVGAIDASGTHIYGGAVQDSTDEYTIHSTLSGGNWNSNNTWEEGRVPNVDDKVLVQGLVEINMDNGVRDICVSEIGELDYVYYSGYVISATGNIVNYGKIDVRIDSYGDLVNNGSWYNWIHLLGTEPRDIVGDFIASFRIFDNIYINGSANFLGSLYSVKSFFVEDTLTVRSVKSDVIMIGGVLKITGSFSGDSLQAEKIILEKEGNLDIYGDCEISGDVQISLGTILRSYSTKRTMNINGQLINYGYINYIDLSVSGSIFQHGDWISSTLYLVGNDTRVFEGEIPAYSKFQDSFHIEGSAFFSYSCFFYNKISIEDTLILGSLSGDIYLESGILKILEISSAESIKADKVIFSQIDEDIKIYDNCNIFGDLLIEENTKLYSMFGKKKFIIYGDVVNHGHLYYIDGKVYGNIQNNLWTSSTVQVVWPSMLDVLSYNFQITDEFGSWNMPISQTDTVYNVTSLIDGNYCWRYRAELDGVTTPWSDLYYINDGQVVGDVALWNGNVDSNWNNSQNWEGNNIPPTYSDVFIPNSCLFYPVISHGDLVIINDLEISENARLIVDAENSLTVEGDVINEGIFILNSPETNAVTGSLIVNGDVIGEIQVERFLSANEFHYISSPLMNQELSVFDNAGVNNVFWYDETGDFTGGWTYLQSPLSGFMNAGQGYAVYSTGPKEVVFYGSPILEDINFNVNYTDGIETENLEGWNLVANPFTSAVSWDIISIYLDENIYNSMYIWDVDNYRCYVKVGPNLNVGVNEGSEFIPAMQGFFIKTKSTTPEGGVNFIIPTFAQVHNLTQFTKSQNNNNYVKNLLRLDLSGNSHNDEMVVYFDKKFTDGVDDYDAFKVFSTNENVPQLYCLNIDEVPLAINSLLFYDELQEIITLGIRIPVSGNYQITPWNNTFYGEVYLEDLYENRMIDFHNAKSYGFYSDAGSFNDRFLLHFGKIQFETQTVDIFYELDNVFVQINTNNDDIKGSVYVYDLLGREVGFGNVVGNIKTSINVNVVCGIYLVKVVFDNEIYSQKIFID